MMRTRCKVSRRQAPIALLCALGLGLVACTGEGERAPLPPTAPSAEVPAVPDLPSAPLFSEIAADVGLDFVHVNGATAEYFFPEVVGSGAALFDYDNDGDLDVLALQSGRINQTTPPLFDIPQGPLTSRLYKSELIETGELSFVDVTEDAGLITDGYTMGVATGDLDGDGDLDVYVTDLGVNALYLNDGAGHFVRQASTITEPGWGTSASFLDYDLDGALDLFVARYLLVDLQTARQCMGATGGRDYCTPDVFSGIPDILLRGDGSGALAPVASWRASPLAPKPGLGVVVADFNLNGLSDLYVANDKKPNQLWLNLGDGRFEETAVMSGSAYDINGKEEASMGVTSGDVDADGDEDIFLSHLKGETNTLYINMGDANFLDSTIEFRLSSSSLPSTGFGTRWFDFDNDTDLDLFVANGAVMIEADQLNVERLPYNQPNQLFENTGDLRFDDASERAGLNSRPPEISRGAAFGDIDNDGDVDILVTNNNGPLRLLRNDAAPDNDWLSVRLRATGGNADGIGARIGVERPGKPTLWRRVGTDGSFLCANDLRTHFGLGPDAAIGDVVVVWPGGARERFSGVQTRRFVTLSAGEGVADGHL